MRKRLLAEVALGQSEQRQRRQQVQLLGRPGRPDHGLGLPPGEELGAGEVVEVQNQRQPLLGQEPGQRGRGRELVHGDVAVRRLLSILPVLVRLPRQIVVDRLGEDLRAPARPAQHVAHPQGVGPGGVVGVEGRDELVDGHRPPGGSAHRVEGGAVKGVISARTAVTRKSRPPGPGSADDV